VGALRRVGCCCCFYARSALRNPPHSPSTRHPPRGLIPTSNFLLSHPISTSSTAVHKLTLFLSSTDLVSQFQALSSSASHLTTLLPREVIQYVEDGRNPDIYTREFVEIVLKYNQLMNGKRKAYERFYKVLNDQMLTAFPELTEEIEKVRLNTVAKK
jgi:hypothetical protein